VQFVGERDVVFDGPDARFDGAAGALLGLHVSGNF
jgi:hypothetical protein